jgi:plasmid stabilization system protein ParE
VPQLVYRAAARRDIAEIAAYIARESKAAPADAFIDELMDYCEHIAKLPGLMGRDAVGNTADDPLGGRRAPVPQAAGPSQSTGHNQPHDDPGKTGHNDIAHEHNR